jgi:hypothetical protein
VRYKGFMSFTGMVRKIQIDNPISFNSCEASYGNSLACFFMGDRMPSNAYAPALHSTQSERMIYQSLPLPRLVLQNCAHVPYLSIESQQYPSLSACSSKQTLIHWYPIKSRVKDTFRCRGITRLLRVRKRRHIPYLDGTTWRHPGLFSRITLAGRLNCISIVTTVSKRDCKCDDYSTDNQLN